MVNSGSLIWGDRLILWSHRGFPGIENSLSAFNQACSEEITHFETDLHATKDGVLILSHDPTLIRLNRRGGQISDLTLAELQRFPIQDIEPWCTLDQLVTSHPDVIISLDMKAQETLNPLITWMRGRDTSNFIVGSFSHKRVQAFRNAHPQIRTALTTREVLLIKFGLARFVRATPFSPKFAMVPAKFKTVTIVTPRFIHVCERKNIQVHVWTVNSVSEVLYLKTLGVTGVVTDNYRILRGV